MKTCFNGIHKMFLNKIKKIMIKTDNRWKHKIDLTHFKFDKEDVSDINISKISKAFEKEIERLILNIDDIEIYSELEDVASGFNFISFLCDSTADEREEYDVSEKDTMVEMFQYQLNELYDISDVDKLIWIQY